MVPDIQSETEGQFFVILGHYLPFGPTNNLENKNLEKNKKIPRDIITLHMCSTYENQMMYGS